MKNRWTLQLLLVWMLSGSAWSNDLPEGFVYLQDVAPEVVQEMRYATDQNFMGQPVTGYEAPRCILTRQAAKALQAVQADVKQQGLTLKVYDCYRPQRAVNHFVAWGQNLADQTMKPVYYPRIDKGQLFEKGYIAEKSGHSRGSTVDITLVPLKKGKSPKTKQRTSDQPAPCTAPVSERLPDTSLDMGTGYDCFDPLAHTLSPDITGEAHWNRLVLKSAMERHGFTNLPEEWWHYTLENEPYPEQYFDFPVR